MRGKGSIPKTSVPGGKDPIFVGVVGLFYIRKRHARKKEQTSVVGS